MRYYNGSMYGRSGDSYPAGTVQGFTTQPDCFNSGLTVQGTTTRGYRSTSRYQAL
jgi:hypothetical protein